MTLSAVPFHDRTMRRVIMSVLSIACLFTAAAQSDPPVETIKLGDRRFELRVTLPGVTDPDLGQRAVLFTAIVACGDLPPSLGRYRFESRKQMETFEAKDASLVFTQEVTCGEANATAASNDDPPPAPVEPPSAAEETLIREKTLAYLAAKDSGDFDTAHAMFNQAMTVLMTEQSWRIPRRAFNAGNGTPTERRVLRITWYDDPPGAPSHGRYAAADYDAIYGNKAFYCGYVMWLRQADGSYRIAREEEGQMSTEVVAKLPADQLANARSQVGCRD